MSTGISAWFAGAALILAAHSASAQQAGCDVTMPQAFRLLERQALASGGPEYPAQTHVRAIIYGTATQGGRRAVRVQIDTAEGWVFLWPAQLRRCPPDSIAQRAGDVAPTAPERPADIAVAPSRPTAPACVPGSTQACLCLGGSSGVQSCAASGTAYEACSCAPPPAPVAAPTVPPPSASGGGSLQIGGHTANFGSRTVTPGFVPDPIQIAVTSGGAIDASRLGLGPTCRGFVTRQPDFIVRLTGATSNLRLYVTAPGDTTLLVNDAAGRWTCNDDSYGGTNPTVDLTDARAGQYDVWVGSYRDGEQIRGALHITELASNHP